MRPKRVYLCQCEDLIHDTERSARNCRECGPRIAYLCPKCGEPKLDYDAAIRCCEGRDSTEAGK